MQYKFDSKPLYSKIAKRYINFSVKPTKKFFAQICLLHCTTLDKTTFKVTSWAIKAFGSNIWSIPKKIGII